MKSSIQTLLTRPLHLDAETMGAVSEAERAIAGLNEVAQPALKPLARLLLRTESIASSKVKGMQTGVRELTRAEAKKDSGGGKPGTLASEILANIDAMELAVEEAATVETFSVSEIEAVHRLLMENLQGAGILVPLSEAAKNRSWEAVGLLDLLARLEAGELPEKRS